MVIPLSPIKSLIVCAPFEANIEAKPLPAYFTIGLIIPQRGLAKLLKKPAKAICL